jgi:hypothetical protein
MIKKCLIVISGELKTKPKIDFIEDVDGKINAFEIK